MPKNNENKKDLLRRLKIISGHLNKIIQMVETDVYCLDIMQQTSAVKSAIKKAEEVLLANHLDTCVLNAIKQERGKQAMAELLEVFKKTA